jgi:outer membrane protein OmpA-like peptidoglycan-associated protein
MLPPTATSEPPGTKAGDPAAGYVERIACGPNDAIDASTGAVQAGSRSYGAAKARAASSCVLNGITSQLALGRCGAEEAFGKVVDYGLKAADQSKPLAVKFLFRKNASRFDRYDREYAMWLKQVAQRTAKAGGCLEIVGHTSPTGPAALNDRLSHLRAEHVRDRLQEQARGLHQRLITTGVGSRQTVVGTGKDDQRCALTAGSSSRRSR